MMRENKNGHYKTDELGSAAGWRAAVYTFSDVVENHVGMQKLGEERPALGEPELQVVKGLLEARGVRCRLLDLRAESGLPAGPAGFVLIGENAVAALGEANASQREADEEGSGGVGPNAEALWAELKALGVAGVDRQFLNRRRGLVQSKRARWNFNVCEVAQRPEIAAGRGTVHAFSSLPELAKVRAGLGRLGIERLAGLNAEANIYFSEDTGIGFHGDGERNIVVGVCIGSTVRHIEWQAFERCMPVGGRIRVQLTPGDVYWMDGGATGRAWAASGYATLHWRHRAGFERWLEREERNNKRKWARMRACEGNGKRVKTRK